MGVKNESVVSGCIRWEYFKICGLYSWCHRSNIKMKIIRSRFGFATIGIISGHPRFDKTAARVIDCLAAQSKEPVDFIGVIGNQYANKLSTSYASSSILDHEEI